MPLSEYFPTFRREIMRSTWESSSSRGRYTARELKPTSPHPPKRFLRLRILEDKGIITLRKDGNFSERHSVLYQRTWTFTVMLFLGSHAILREATFSFVMSVRPHVSSRLLPYGLPWNLYLKFFFQNLPRNLTFYSNMTRITGTLYEDLFTFMVSLWVLLGVRNVLEKVYQ